MDATALDSAQPDLTSPALPGWLPPWAARLPGWTRRPSVLAVAGGSVAVVAAIVAIAVAAGLVRGAHGPAPKLTLPVAGASPAAGSAGSGSPASPAATTPGPDPPASPQPTGATVTVHAAGAVANPGIYAVPTGARVADVITAAGGAVPEADLDRVNLAERLADGERVYVPRKGEPDPPDASAAGTATSATGGSASAPTPTAPLDLNAATAEQLDTLPGVGPATAQAIITYRSRHGRFRSVTELLEVPGIGPAKLEAVRALVRV